MIKNYGKFPFEPYGALGGVYRRHSPSAGRAIGQIVGSLIGLTAAIGFKAAAAAVKGSCSVIKNAWLGFSRGIIDANRS